MPSSPTRRSASGSIGSRPRKRWTSWASARSRWSIVCARCRPSTSWPRKASTSRRSTGRRNDGARGRRGERDMAYSDKVIDHYSNPRNVGSFGKDTPGVGTGLVGAPECGDVMKLQIKVNLETGVIEDAKFKTFGCGSAIASSSLATEWLKGKTIDEAAKIKNTDIVNELKLPPVKIHCSVLAEDAIKAALADYKEKSATTAVAAASK